MGISKRAALFALLVCIIFTSSCGPSNDSQGASASKSGKKYASTMQDQSKMISSADTMQYSNANAVTKNIEDIVKNSVAIDADISLESLTVMALQGTDDSDDYTVRCFLSMKNAGVASTAYDKISEFTAELATKLDAYSGAAGELSVAWTVPELTGSGRLTYKKIDGALELSTADFDDNLNVKDNEQNKTE